MIVAFPLTFKLPPIPTPPDTTNAPEVLLLDIVLDDIITFPKLENPPTFRLPPIPTPPETINAPVVGFVELVVEVIKTFPFIVEFKITFIFLPIFTFSETPTPPATMSVPELTLDEIVLAVMRTIPFKDTSETKLETPVKVEDWPTLKFALIFTDSPTPIPPETIRAPV